MKLKLDSTMAFLLLLFLGVWIGMFFAVKAFWEKVKGKKLPARERTTVIAFVALLVTLLLFIVGGFVIFR